MKRYSEEPEILAGRWPNASAGNRELLEYVNPIVADVAANGDQAVGQYTERFDKVKLDSFKVTPEEIQIAYSNVTQEQADALRESRRRLEIVESQRLAQSNFMVEISGANIR
ncbi:MAG: histidinol dehydrogenase, partial [Candidatus Bathyarchaeota archaeon]